MSLLIYRFQRILISIMVNALFRHSKYFGICTSLGIYQQKQCDDKSNSLGLFCKLVFAGQPDGHCPQTRAHPSFWTKVYTDSTAKPYIYYLGSRFLISGSFCDLDSCEEGIEIATQRVAGDRKMTQN